MLALADLTTLPALAAAPEDREAKSDGPVTLLRLSAAGTVQETPDLLTADLTGESDARDAAAAQARLDDRMATASRLAADQKTVSWRLQDYQTSRSGDTAQGTPAGWSARQTLHLEGGTSDALLELVGRLQAMGLSVDDLSWTLSAAKRADADARATDKALRSLRARADAAAASLGLKVGAIRSVVLGEQPEERPRPLMRMMAAAPQATQDAQAVTETASAEIALHP